MVRLWLLALMLLVATVASASPVYVTFQGIGSGTLNGIPFTNQAYQIDITGDNSATFVEYNAVWLPSCPSPKLCKAGNSSI